MGSVAVSNPVAPEPRPLHVVVTLGTDHHPFTRLVGWVDSWAAEHPEVHCIVQHGTAPAPRTAEGHAMLDPADIPGLMGRARIVVGHAGPGTVLDARVAGRRPVVVPRLARFGEVVDDHQVAFGRWMDERGMAVCVDDERGLRAHLDAALTDADRYALPVDDGTPPPAVTLFSDLVDGILTR